MEKMCSEAKVASNFCSNRKNNFESMNLMEVSKSKGELEIGFRYPWVTPSNLMPKRERKLLK
jgi:hypothetical protein